MGISSLSNKILFTPAILISLGFSQTSGIFFSEYCEGSSYNKYLEIYNGTESDLDLSGFAFPNVSNDPSTVGEHEYWNTFPDGATVAAGDVYVIAHGSSDEYILGFADHTFSYLSNGDDGFCLVEGTEDSYTLVDCIGDFNGDPGDGWDVAGVTEGTKDHTLVRKLSVNEGNAGDWTSSAGTNAQDSEWVVLGEDTWDYLGSHIHHVPGRLYVSNNGSNETGIGSTDLPFATIQKGIDESSDGDTILVAPGTYVENLIIDGKDIWLVSHHILYPDSLSLIDNTIITALDNTPTITFTRCDEYDNVDTVNMSTTLIQGFTFSGGYLCDSGLEDDLSGDNYSNNITIKRCNFINSGYNIFTSNPTFEFCLFNNSPIINTNNQSWSHIYIYNSTLYGLENHIYANSFQSQVWIYNSILNGSIHNNWGPIRSYYSCIDSTEYSGSGTFEYEEGNIFWDPLFCNPANNDFTLYATSPCLVTGQNGNHMGAFGIGCGAIINIVINEIMQNPSAVTDSDGEWFELYNAGEDTVDISGWVFKDTGNDYLFLDVDCCLDIAPNEYFLMISNGDSVLNSGISNYDFIYERESFNLGNGDDEIIMIDSYGREIDRVEYDGGTNFPDPDGKSMELNFYNENNNIGSNWTESENLLPSGDYGTPGYENSMLKPEINIESINTNQGNLLVNSGSFDPPELGDCIIINFPEQIVGPCDTAYFSIVIENNGNADLIIDDYHFTEDLFPLEDNRWNLNDSIPIIIPPISYDTLIVQFIPWRYNDFEYWYGIRNNTLILSNNDMENES